MRRAMRWICVHTQKYYNLVRLENYESKSCKYKEYKEHNEIIMHKYMRLAFFEACKTLFTFILK